MLLFGDRPRAWAPELVSERGPQRGLSVYPTRSFLPLARPVATRKRSLCCSQCSLAPAAPGKLHSSARRPPQLGLLPPALSPAFARSWDWSARLPAGTACPSRATHICVLSSPAGGVLTPSPNGLESPGLANQFRGDLRVVASLTGGHSLGSAPLPGSPLFISAPPLPCPSSALPEDNVPRA